MPEQIVLFTTREPARVLSPEAIEGFDGRLQEVTDLATFLQEWFEIDLAVGSVDPDTNYLMGSLTFEIPGSLAAAYLNRPEVIAWALTEELTPEDLAGNTDAFDCCGVGGQVGLLDNCVMGCFQTYPGPHDRWVLGVDAEGNEWGLQIGPYLTTV